jgi:hypothetical protein
MTKKEELLEQINQYDIAYFDYKALKKYLILALFLFFIGGFVLFLILQNKKNKLNKQHQLIVKTLNSLNSELPLDEYLVLFERVLKIGRE